MRWHRPTEACARVFAGPGRLAVAVRVRWSETDGQGVVEYGLILSLSVLFAAVLLVFFGGTLSAVLQAVGDAIDSAT